MRTPDFQQNGFDGYNINVDGQVIGTWVNTDNEPPERVEQMMNYLEANMTTRQDVAQMPTLITKGQLIRALYQLHGITAEQLDTAVYAVIDQLPAQFDKTALQYLWRYSNDIDMTKPETLMLMDAVAGALGLTQQQVPEGILLAATL